MITLTPRHPDLNISLTFIAVLKMTLANAIIILDRIPCQKKTEEIEIVVPDVTNKDRDPSDKNKFYKYVVYNHTICTCGNLTYRNRKLYKTITNNEG